MTEHNRRTPAYRPTRPRGAEPRGLRAAGRTCGRRTKGKSTMQINYTPECSECGTPDDSNVRTIQGETLCRQCLEARCAPKVYFRQTVRDWLSVHADVSGNPDEYAGCIHPAFVDGRKRRKMFQLSLGFATADGRIVAVAEIYTSITRCQLAAKAIIEEECGPERAA